MRIINIYTKDDISLLECRCENKYDMCDGTNAMLQQG